MEAPELAALLRRYEAEATAAAGAAERACCLARTAAETWGQVAAITDNARRAAAAPASPFWAPTLRPVEAPSAFRSASAADVAKAGAQTSLADAAATAAGAQELSSALAENDAAQADTTQAEVAEEPLQAAGSIAQPDENQALSASVFPPAAAGASQLAAGRRAASAAPWAGARLRSASAVPGSGGGFPSLDEAFRAPRKTRVVSATPCRRAGDERAGKRAAAEPGEIALEPTQASQTAQRQAQPPAGPQPPDQLAENQPSQGSAAESEPPPSQPASPADDDGGTGSAPLAALPAELSQAARAELVALLSHRAGKTVTETHVVFTVTSYAEGYQAEAKLSRWLGGNAYEGGICENEDAARRSAAETAVACIRIDMANRNLRGPDRTAPSRPRGAPTPAQGAQRGSARDRLPSRDKFASQQRKPWQDMSQATGIPPPYLVTTEGHMTGYKVHVGDLPGSWNFGQRAQWVRKTLARSECPVPDDFGPSLGTSDRQQTSQMLLTFEPIENAQRARVALNGQRVDGKRSNARFWVPTRYDPKSSDPRFASWW